MKLSDLPELEPETLLTPSEVGQHLSVTARTVQRWIHAGSFPNYKTVKTGFLIPWGDVIALVEAKQ